MLIGTGWWLKSGLGDPVSSWEKGGVRSFTSFAGNTCGETWEDNGVLLMAWEAWLLGGDANVLEQVSRPTKDVGDPLPFREKRAVSGIYQVAGDFGGETKEDSGMNLLFWEGLKKMQLCASSESCKGAEGS